MNRHRCEQLPCPECGMDFTQWADANRVESIERSNAEMREALLAIANMSEGPEVNGGFDEPYSAQAAREALAKQWIGPCIHGRDPWDRCDEPECVTQTSAWEHACARGAQ